MKDKKIRRKRVTISPVTIIIILILLLVFAALNFYVFPKIYESQKGPIIVDIPKIKLGNSQFVNEELEKRKLDIPTMTPPDTAIGKANPFEEQ